MVNFPTSPESGAPTQASPWPNLQSPPLPCAHACPTQAILYEEAETADWLGDFAAARASGTLVAVGGDGSH